MHTREAGERQCLAVEMRFRLSGHRHNNAALQRTCTASDKKQTDPQIRIVQSKRTHKNCEIKQREPECRMLLHSSAGRGSDPSSSILLRHTSSQQLTVMPHADSHCKRTPYVPL